MQRGTIGYNSQAQAAELVTRDFVAVDKIEVISDGVLAGQVAITGVLLTELDEYFDAKHVSVEDGTGLLISPYYMNPHRVADMLAGLQDD